MPIHVVRQGEHLSGIAHRYGLSPDAIWSDADNERLRSRRPNPHMLAPGDLLKIPDRLRPARAPVEASASNRFKATAPRVNVDLILRRGDDPIAGEPFEVHGAGPVVHGTTEGDGRAHFEVPAFAREVRIVLPASELHYTLHIGGLDPIEEPSGILQRLAHLGFSFDPLHPAASASGGHDAEAERVASERAETERLIPRRLLSDPTTAAIALFQHARGLDVTGAVDARTKDAILRTYGS